MITGLIIENRIFVFAPIKRIVAGGAVMPVYRGFVEFNL